MAKVFFIVVLGCGVFTADFALAQELYAGSAFGRDEVRADMSNVEGEIGNNRPSFPAVGLRFDVGSNWFLAGEILSGTPPRNAEGFFRPENESAQTELFVGYSGETATIFGYIGLGAAIFGTSAEIIQREGPLSIGIGAEFGVSENISVRLDSGFTEDEADLPCCENNIGRVVPDISAGILFSF